MPGLTRVFAAALTAVMLSCIAPLQPARAAEQIDKAYTPERNSAERRAILDALRVPIEGELKQPVTFVVSKLNVYKDWAFVIARPQKPDGTPVDYHATPYWEAIKEGMFGGIIFSLLRKHDGSWRIVTYDLGATDVSWLTWAKDFDAPEALFPKICGTDFCP
jgi:hypothetical protein